MQALALLDIGPTEFLLIAGLFLLLFGADKVPDLARSIGRATAQLRSASSEVRQQLDREQGLDRPGDAVPRDQYAMVQQAEAERGRLEQAARALGIDPAGKTDAELRSAIQDGVRR